MTPKCSEFSENLTLEAVGELAGQARAALRAHLGSCAACRAELEHVQSALAALRESEISPEGYFAALEARLQGRLREEAAPRQERLSRLARFGLPRLVVGWPAAAAAVLTAALAAVLWIPALPPTEAQMVRKMRSLSFEERAAVLAPFEDPDAWRAGDPLAAAFLAEEVWESASLEMNGFNLDTLGEEALSFLYEEASAEIGMYLPETLTET
jgi:predicted anti-sigma-YlaC factor YlaD